MPAGDADLGRITIPFEVRDRATAIRRAAASAFQTIGNQWTTSNALERAKGDLLRIAEDALAAHRLLMEEERQRAATIADEEARRVAAR